MRKKLSLFLLPALAAAGLAGSVGAQPMPQDRGPMGDHMRGPMGGPMGDRMGGRPPIDSMAISARDFVMKAGASDLYEKTSSQIVLATTRDPGVRRFAQNMIRDHTSSTNKVKMAAMRSGIRPRPPMLDPDQRRMVSDLRQARGRDRDRLYVDQQRTAHDQALALHEGYARNGDAPALRRAAGEIAPVVRMHIGMLRDMRM